MSLWKVWGVSSETSYIYLNVVSIICLSLKVDAKMKEIGGVSKICKCGSCYPLFLPCYCIRFLYEVKCPWKYLSSFFPKKNKNKASSSNQQLDDFFIFVYFSCKYHVYLGCVPLRFLMWLILLRKKNLFVWPSHSTMKLRRVMLSNLWIEDGFCF